MTLYSHSRLSTYENCPMQYKFAYVEEVELPEMVTVEAFMGSRVHEALEKLYRDLKLSKENTLEDILGFYHENWGKQWSDDVKVVRQDYTPKNYLDTGAKCITDYYARYKPFAESKTLDLEKRIDIEIGNYRLQGYIDRLSQRKEGHYEIHDYKTSQYVPAKKYLEKDRQLALYQIGVENLWGDAKEVDLIWHYLVHDKEIRSKRTSEEIKQLKAEIVSLIKDIEKAEEGGNFPARESQLCDWCEYQALCPRRKHIVGTEEMPPNQYLKDPGVKLVNEYARLIEEKRKFLEGIENEIAKLEEAIVAFAKKEGVEVIRGSDKKLLVKIETKPKFPGKKEDGRKELDELIKSAGKWMDVSDLNTYSLGWAIRNGGWSSELIKKIKKYQTLEESYRIWLSSFKERE